jgi:hypothetical protein
MSTIGTPCFGMARLPQFEKRGQSHFPADAAALPEARQPNEALEKMTLTSLFLLLSLACYIASYRHGYLERDALGQ